MPTKKKKKRARKLEGHTLSDHERNNPLIERRLESGDKRPRPQGRLSANQPNWTADEVFADETLSPWGFGPSSPGGFGPQSPLGMIKSLGGLSVNYRLRMPSPTLGHPGHPVRVEVSSPLPDDPPEDKITELKEGGVVIPAPVELGSVSAPGDSSMASTALAEQSSIKFEDDVVPGSVNPPPSISEEPPVPASTETGEETSADDPLHYTRLVSFRGADATEILRDLHWQGLTTIDMLRPYEHLRALFLCGNNLKDMTSFSACPQLRVLDLSFNQLKRLPDAETWSEFETLQFLYLNDNNLGVKAVLKASGAPELVALTVANNPANRQPEKFRRIAANKFRRLELLDTNLITDEDIISKANFGPHFQSCHPNTRFSTEIMHRRQLVCRDSDLMLLLDMHQSAIRCAFLNASPIVVVQRFVRRYVKNTRTFEHFRGIREKLKMMKESISENIRTFSATVIQSRMRRRFLEMRGQRLLNIFVGELDDFWRVVPAERGVDLYAAAEATVLVQRCIRRFLAVQQKRHEAATRITQLFRRFVDVCDTIGADMFQGPPSNHGLFVDEKVLASLLGVLDDHVDVRFAPVVRQRSKSPRRHYFNPEDDASVNSEYEEVPDYYSLVGPGSSIHSRPWATFQMQSYVKCSRFWWRFHFHGRREARPLGSCVEFTSYLALKRRGFRVSKAEAKALSGKVHDVDAILEGVEQARIVRSGIVQNPLLWIQITSKKQAIRILRTLKRDGYPILTAHYVLSKFAVLALQAMWRSFYVRSSVDLPHLVLRRRAVVCLQRWWRCLSGLKRRLSFVQLICDYIETIDSQTVFMDAGTYYLFVNQSRPMMNMIKDNCTRRGVRFQTDEFSISRFHVEPPGSPDSIHLPRVPPMTRPKDEIHTALPSRVREKITRTRIEELRAGYSVDDGASVDVSIDNTVDSTLSMLRILSTDVRAEILGPEFQAPDPDNPDSLDEPSDNRNLIKLEFTSVSEARKRAAMLMQATFNWVNCQFVLLFSNSVMTQPSVASFWVSHAVIFHPALFSHDDTVRFELLKQTLSRDVIPMTKTLSSTVGNYAPVAPKSGRPRPSASIVSPRARIAGERRLVPSAQRVHPLEGAPTSNVNTISYRDNHDLEMNVRRKLQRLREEEEMERKQRAAVYVAPKPAPPKLTPLQQWETAEFVRERKEEKARLELTRKQRIQDKQAAARGALAQETQRRRVRNESIEQENADRTQVNKEELQELNERLQATKAQTLMSKDAAVRGGHVVAKRQKKARKARSMTVNFASFCSSRQREDFSRSHQFVKSHNADRQRNKKLLFEKREKSLQKETVMAWKQRQSKEAHKGPDPHKVPPLVRVDEPQVPEQAEMPADFYELTEPLSPHMPNLEPFATPEPPESPVPPGSR